MSSGTPNFYGSAASNGGVGSTGTSSTIRSTRPVQPKPSGTGNAATSRRTTGAAPRPRSAYRSPRATASTTAAAATTTAATGSASTTNAKSSSSSLSSSSSARTSASAARSRSTHLAASRPAKPSRPVGSYYATAPAPMPVAAPAPGAPVATATSTATSIDASADDNDTWEDWGSPAPKASASASTPQASTVTNDWYSAPSGYTSSGFGVQQQQQQQQQPSQPSQQQQQQQQQQTQSVPMQPGNGFYNQSLSGAMDSSAQTMGQTQPVPANNTSSSMSSFSMFMPTMQDQDTDASGSAFGNTDMNTTTNNFEDEAPLLEELGINVQHILLKTKAVVVPFSRFGGDQIDPAVICQEADMPGPVALLLLLGGEMVLTGKLQFGYIYVYGLLGCIAMTLVANLISPTEAVSFWTVTSIMGYSLLPVNILALIKIFVMDLIHLQTLGNFLGALTVLWSTLASTRLLELGCGMRDQRYLIMYPLLLFYSAFVMMTIF